MEIKKIIAKKAMPWEDAEKLVGTYLDENNFDTLITEDTDCTDVEGNLLFKFRKSVLDLDTLQTGYNSFKGSIELTEGRGIASGSSHKRIRKDGSVSNTTVGNLVYSGNVGSMDASAMVRYCRKTSFAKNYFDKFLAGVQFVSSVDGLYKELCPEYYAKQRKIADSTDINYVIGDTTFTTVTVNRNFITAVHKDSGDFREGFGNLCIYREGNWTGGYFCLPQYRISIDMRNTDMLFVDVHKHHGNTPFENFQDEDLRIAFVMYYREYMYKCKSPSEELQQAKINQTGFYKL